MSTVVATDRISATTGVPQFAPPPYSHTWASERGYTVVRWILGLLLITTAVMKLTGGSGEILRVALPFVSPRIYASGVVFELILGLWLISGVARAWAWLISLLFFGLLGYISFRLGWFGQASCGCFGKIAVNPWWVFAIDVAAIGMLIVFRPRLLAYQWRDGFVMIAGTTILFSFAASALIAWRGSPGAALAFIRGESVSISSIVTVGQGAIESIADGTVQIWNYSGVPVRIYGSTGDCGFSSSYDLPIVIGPFQSSSVRFVIRRPSMPGEFAKRGRFLTDKNDSRSLDFMVTGRALPDARTGDSSN